MDIDHLDAINQDHGRGRGDLVLPQVAGILTVTVRQSDMVARVEQDDFAILLFGVGRGDARSVGGCIRKAIESFNFAGPGRDPTRSA